MENLKPEGIYVKIVMPTAHASWAWLFSNKRGCGGVHLTSTLDKQTQMLGCRKKNHMVQDCIDSGKSTASSKSVVRHTCTPGLCSCMCHMFHF